MDTSMSLTFIKHSWNCNLVYKWWPFGLRPKGYRSPSRETLPVSLTLVRIPPHPSTNHLSPNRILQSGSAGDKTSNQPLPKTRPIISFRRCRHGAGTFRPPGRHQIISLGPSRLHQPYRILLQSDGCGSHSAKKCAFQNVV